MKKTDDHTFHASLKQRGVTLVDFTAVWCPPCKALLPILEDLSHSCGAAVEILKIDVDESPQTASQYGVMSMPTVIVFKDGQPMEKLVGLRGKTQYQTMIEKYMA